MDYKIIYKAKIVKTVDNCRHIEAFAIVNGIEFKACVTENYHTTDYFHVVNGMNLHGKDMNSHDNIEKNMLNWANNEILEFIEKCKIYYKE